MVWLEHLDDLVQYTFHADRMGHFSLNVNTEYHVWYRDASR